MVIWDIVDVFVVEVIIIVVVYFMSVVVVKFGLVDDLDVVV